MSRKSDEVRIYEAQAREDALALQDGREPRLIATIADVRAASVEERLSRIEECLCECVSREEYVSMKEALETRIEALKDQIDELEDNLRRQIDSVESDLELRIGSVEDDVAALERASS